MPAATTTIQLSVQQFTVLNTSLHVIASALQSQPFWNTQLFAAILGALLGLIPSFYLLWKDRAIIKVKINHIFVPFMATGQMRNGLSVKIYNHGRRAINLEHVYFKFKDGESLVFLNNSNFVEGSSGLPKVLGEGASHSVSILAGEFAGMALRKQSYPVSACYSDALGKEYKCKVSKEFWDTLFKVNAEQS